MKKSYKCVIFVLSLCAAFVLGMGTKSLTDDFKAHTKQINTDTISNHIRRAAPLPNSR